MSFLEQLQTKKSQLKETKIVITKEDGSVYMESKDGLVKLERETYGFVVDTKPDTIPACILEDTLYLGSQDSVTTENIDKYQLTHILSLGIETPYIDDREVVKRYIPCLDLPETNMEEIFEDASEFIHIAVESEGVVLVHCNAGVSRSASVVIAFLILKTGISFEEALKLVKEKRPAIQPNSGFVEQLRKLISFNK